VKELENHIESIITRKISGEITADEQRVIDEWLAESSENEQYFQNHGNYPLIVIASNRT
jgi:hypothetical protein